MKRRQFLGQTSSLLSLSVLPGSAESGQANNRALPAADNDRAYWLQTLLRVAEPVLMAAATGTLKTTMPIEAAAGQAENRRQVSHLEALGRTLAGLAPWLETPAPADEAVRQRRFRTLSLWAIGQAVDPQSSGFLNFSTGGQPLVDAAFLAHSLLRAPTQLWAALPGPTQAQLVTALQQTRRIKPGYNNWLLFSAMVEAALLKLTGQADELRIDYAIREHQTWYKGDGAYGDGPDFHWDYYNSYVIQPMLLDVVRTLIETGKETQPLLTTLLARARRYGVVQERLIGPDGSFAAFGRSLAYRCGAFQLLAQLALQQQLPDELTPGQVRAGLTAVIRRTMDAPGTFDPDGWLQIGLCGHQPGIGETYISTGSLYLCTVVFLPLGLPLADPFWQSPPADWTAKKIWSGADVPTDHALKG
jgi:hypothetical protein